MLTKICPKLPMRNKTATSDFYINKLGFRKVGNADYDDYLMVEKDSIEIHLFLFKQLDPNENYGQTYIRTDDIDALYQVVMSKNFTFAGAGHPEVKPWGQKEFSLLDPDNNLLTFGQTVY